MTMAVPELISVNEYISEVKEDIDSPISSSFPSRMQACKNTVADLEEVTKTHWNQIKVGAWRGVEVLKKLCQPIFDDVDKCFWYPMNQICSYY